MAQPIRTQAPKRYWNDASAGADARVFAARLTTNLTANSGVPKDIPWDDVLKNDLVSYNSGTGVITITETGIYEVSMQLGFIPNFAGTYRQVFLKLNGATTWAFGNRSLGAVSEATETVPCVHRATLTAGDTLLTQALVNGGVDCTISGNGSTGSIKLSKL